MSEATTARYLCHVRLQHANTCLQIIGSHGRRIFYNDTTDTYARFELDAKSKVWFVDDFRGTRVYFEKVAGEFRFKGLSHGGGMANLLLSMRNYIKNGTAMRKDEIVPQRLDGSNYWGYAEDAAAHIRAEIFKLPLF